MYATTTSPNKMKNGPFKGARFKMPARGEKGRAVKMAMPMKVSSITGADARDSMKGILGVRIMWMTSVCVHMEMTIQPAWKMAMKSAICAGSVNR